MYKLRIIAQSIVAVYVALSASVGFRGYGRVPVLLTILACVSMLWLVSCRTTWLPFLGPTAMPVGVFKTSEPAYADSQYELTAPSNAIRVVYWGSSIKAKDPIRAYGGYVNSGVADVSADGKAVLRLRRPKEYEVLGYEIRPHVHYRWITSRGILSSVKTLYI
jgi:hypothetical protein